MKVCVRCGVPLQMMPGGRCPDAYPGGLYDPAMNIACLVMHYEDRCPKCGGLVWERTQENTPATT